MNVNFTYTDRFYLKGKDCNVIMEWTSPKSITLEQAIEKAREFIDFGMKTVTITSATTGELIAEAERDEDDDSFENAEDDDFDFEDDVDECGYNPYMGCYDYDC